MCRLMMGWYFFFFSSRRRHTSWPRDWSSDVCSSDLGLGTYGMTAGGIWTYTLDNSNSTVESLNNGQSTTDTFTVTTVDGTRSEEHTSELQSRGHLVCRLLLEKKKETTCRL